MPSPGSHFVTRETAQAAVEMTLPMIHEAMQRKEVGESGFLYLVVMHPALTPANSSYEDAVLYEHSVGDRAKWDADYAWYAHTKARAAWQAGMDGQMVQESYPHLMTGGDPVLWGSVVVERIVVGASGCNPWYDEAFAGSVAMCLRALAKEALQKQRNR